MKLRRLPALLLFAIQLTSCASVPHSGPAPVLAPVAAPVADQDPAELYGELFIRVQTAPVFADSKEFVDMIPKSPPEVILSAYRQERPETVDQLTRFVQRHFDPPGTAPTSEIKDKQGDRIEAHIKKLWQVLTRQPHEEMVPGASLIRLPHPYLVPGGRFREIYYWDSYFTQLGLLADGEEELFRNMVKNFDALLVTVGRIPNGNRDYYRSRSQPPVFSYMVALWQDKYGAESAAQFLPALKREHEFWMKSRAISEGPAAGLNHYGDDKATPRPEAYKEDVALAQRAKGRSAEEVYRDLRAGAESGWDFSTRWFADPSDFSTIQTTSFAPVDLNSLLYSLEQKIAELSRARGDLTESERYQTMAAQRRQKILELMWDENTGTFRDYNWRTQTRAVDATAAALTPLFAGVATAKQAERVARFFEAKLLKPGGMVTTARASGQQWDAPNGWAPLQWFAYAGLRRYGKDEAAERLRTRWLKLNLKVYQATGKLMEKYDVSNLGLRAGGGEYPTQDGFGWTNGVYRAFTQPDLAVRHLGIPSPRR